jgi:hypothetical protein
VSYLCTVFKMKSPEKSKRSSRTSDPRFKQALQVQTLLSRAVRQTCWHVSVGGCTSPSFELALGRKIKRETMLNNPMQPREFCRYRPQISFLVWCTWRLERANEIIISSDGAELDIISGLEQLVGKNILRVRIEHPAWDLAFYFADRFRLRVFVITRTATRTLTH